MTSPSTDAAPVSTGVRAFVVVVLPFSLGYYLSYLYRSVNAVLAPQLVEEIGLSAGDLGLLTAAYFFTFAAVQVPLGMWLDRYGPRRVLACLLCVAATGAFIFSFGETKIALIAGRALIGLGVSATMMGPLKAITLWFPEKRWPMINGFFLAMGGVGAMSATTPVEALLDVTDWRGIFVALSVVTVAVAAMIFLIVPERRDTEEKEERAGPAEGLKVIYTDRFFWRAAPLTVVGQATGLSIQGLWAGPWLKDVAGLGRGDVVDTLFVIAGAMTLGYIGMGVLADLAERIGIKLEHFIAGGVVVYMAALATIVFEVAPEAVWPWFVFGIMSNIALLCFPLLSRAFSLELSGRVFTAINMWAILGAFAAQYGIGAVIDLWPVTADGGYDREAYRTAFGSMLTLMFLAFLWFLVPHNIKPR